MARMGPPNKELLAAGIRAPNSWVPEDERTPVERRVDEVLERAGLEAGVPSGPFVGPDGSPCGMNEPGAVFLPALRNGRPPAEATVEYLTRSGRHHETILMDDPSAPPSSPGAPWDPEIDPGQTFDCGGALHHPPNRTRPTILSDAAAYGPGPAERIGDQIFADAIVGRLPEPTTLLTQNLWRFLRALRRAAGLVG